ncbi:MAG TPA: hypothetical protein VIK89_10120 [Cytophagaceae bacterium]
MKRLNILKLRSEFGAFLLKLCIMLFVYLPLLLFFLHMAMKMSMPN